MWFHSKWILFKVEMTNSNNFFHFPLDYFSYEEVRKYPRTFYHSQNKMCEDIHRNCEWQNSINSIQLLFQLILLMNHNSMEGTIIVGFFLQREQLDLTNSILCGETILINESSKQYAFKVWDTQTSSFSFKPWLSFWYWDCGMQLREHPRFLEKSISIINRHNVLIITIDNGKMLNYCIFPLSIAMNLAASTEQESVPCPTVGPTPLSSLQLASGEFIAASCLVCNHTAVN